MARDGEATWTAATYDAWFERPWGRHAFAVESTAVLAALGPLAGRRVLEVGCGTGRLLAEMTERGAMAIGLDREPAMAELATRRTRAPVLRADAGALPFPEASLDAVVAVALLEFVADPAGVMAELCRVTRPEGRVVIGALNVRSPWGMAHRRGLRRTPWTAARFLARHELRALAAPVGEATLHGTLLLPGPVPGLARWGPLLESLGRLVPQAGAFQVLAIDRRQSWRSVANSPAIAVEDRTSGR
ncbi:MAG TPA: class I SAM-dependent methyltransferase [Acidimicrobiales bacterium]|nr:class I SAM-dependent methyltransferase [Acidimicrobiales bacterium]